MKLSRLFKGLKGESRQAPGKSEGNAAPPRPQKKAAPAAPPAAKKQPEKAAVTDRAGERQSTAGGSTKTAAPDFNDVANMFGTIQSVLNEQEEEPQVDEKYLEIPCAAVLARLPEEARGPGWQDGAYPDSAVLLVREDVLKQLRSGRVAYPLAVLRPFLPEGWASKEADMIVELDLPQVVAAVPPDLLTGAAQSSGHIEEVTVMRELFSPKRPLAEAGSSAASDAPASETSERAEVAAEEDVAQTNAPEPSVAPDVQRQEAVKDSVEPLAEPEPPVPAAVKAEVEDQATPDAQEIQKEPLLPDAAPVVTAPAAGAHKSSRRYQPVDWDGIENSQLTATGGVDINTATVEELEALPGVGPVRAREIVSYRERHGRFENVYDLGSVPGIGTRYFRQMTGLSLTTGRDRHETLNKLLNAAPEDTLSLLQVLRALTEIVNGVGCVLAGADGVPLAYTPSLAKQADQYAAIGSQLFRRTGRYLETIAGESVECLALPASDPPLLLFSVNGIYLSVVQNEKSAGQRQFKKAYAVAREIGWLLGKRAIVRGR